MRYFVLKACFGSNFYTPLPSDRGAGPAEYRSADMTVGISRTGPWWPKRSPPITHHPDSLINNLHNWLSQRPPTVASQGPANLTALPVIDLLTCCLTSASFPNLFAVCFLVCLLFPSFPPPSPARYSHIRRTQITRWTRAARQRRGSSSVM